MRFFTDRIAKLRLDWNERPLGEADLYRICRRYRITVDEMPLTVGGFYYRLLGKDFIAVDSRLPPVEKLAVLWHELGHFLFHAPSSGETANFHRLRPGDRKELEADLFAVCALIPRNWLETRTPAEIIDDGIPPKMLSARYEVFRQHGI